MRNIITVYQRELRGYFATPVAYVFLIVFLILSGFLTWGMGGQYERDQADLQAFDDFDVVHGPAPESHRTTGGKFPVTFQYEQVAAGCRLRSGGAFKEDDVLEAFDLDDCVHALVEACG